MVRLGKNLKHLRNDMNLSQKELADALEVSQTSIAHYEKGTRQPSIDTMIEMASLFDVSLDSLIGYTKPDGLDLTDKSIDTILIELTTLLMEKKERKVFDYFKKYIITAFSIEEVLFNILKPILYNVGFLWQTGAITEADEHYATDVINKMLNYINFTLEDEIPQKKVVSFIVSSEKHSVGMKLINTFLKSMQVETIYLGSDLPHKSIKTVIKDHTPDYVMISITLSSYMNNLIRLLEDLKEEFGNNLKIIVGGQGLHNPDILQKYENVIIANGVEKIKELFS